MFDLAADLAKRFPREFLLAANQVPTLPDAIASIEQQLAKGGRLIGELQYAVDCQAHVR